VNEECQGGDLVQRCDDKSAACRCCPSDSQRPARYPIEDASNNKLTDLDESPRVGFQALCTLLRWLGSRHEQSSAARVGDAAAGAAADGRDDARANSVTPGPKPLSCRGDDQ
jgi:hypothetical protein